MSSLNDALAAVKAGDAERFGQLLAADASLAEARDDEGVSLLLRACYAGQRSMAELLAKRRSSLDAFELAALGRTNELLEAISEDESQLDSRSSDGFTPLHLACYFGSDACVKMLLEQGADPNAVADNAMKVAPVHGAVAAGRRHAVNMLILAGADVNARQQKGFTPLQGAAGGGDLDIVVALLEAGADPFARSDTGETALEIARNAGRHDAASRIESAMKKLNRG